MCFSVHKVVLHASVYDSVFSPDILKPLCQFIWRNSRGECIRYIIIHMQTIPLLNRLVATGMEVLIRQFPITVTLCLWIFSIACVSTATSALTVGENISA